MSKKSFEITRLSLFPTSAVVVTSINNKRQVGASTIAWNGILSSRPPVIGVSFLPDSFTRSCILETRDFVINVPDDRYWKEADYLGSLTGAWSTKMKRKPRGLKKLSLKKSRIVRAPRIEEFYLNLECRMLQAIQIGLYDCILGEVLTMHCDKRAFLNNHPKGNVNHNLFEPILCLGDEYWSKGRYLGVSNENKKHPHGSEH